VSVCVRARARVCVGGAPGGGEHFLEVERDKYMHNSRIMGSGKAI
jgi:hypothetical protein